MELLKHTHTHFEPIFMLYPDPAGAIDALLDEAAAGAADRRSDRRVWRHPPHVEGRRRRGAFRS